MRFTETPRSALKSWSLSWRHRITLLGQSAAIALIAWSVLLWLTGRLPQPLDLTIAWLATGRANELIAGALLLTAVLLCAVPQVYRLLAGWARSANWILTDYVVAWGALIDVVGLLVLFQLTQPALVGLEGAPWIAACLVLILLLRALQIRRKGRAEPQESSLNFGLEGAWGSGKTSLLNLLRVRLESEGFRVVMFNLWSYREPDRLVRVYFDRLASAVAREVPYLGARRLVRRVGAGLAELGGGRVAKALQVILGDYGTETPEKTHARLAESLRDLRKPVVVFLDDLDRLDRDELVAVFRSVRLVSELPNLAQVLAYDREQLAKTLFPDDPAGTRARDHIGKIINYELSIGSLPRELTGKLLGDPLSELLERLEDQKVEEFKERFQEQGLRLFADALPTPREVRRVAAATAARWERMAGQFALTQSGLLN